MTRRPSNKARLMTISLMLMLLALAGPWAAPFDPQEVGREPGTLSQSVSLVHWLGTDPLGRDIASRMLAGSRTTLAIAVGAVSLALLLGTLVGTISVVLPPRPARVLLRLTDLLRAVPRVVFLVALVGLLPPSQYPWQLAVLLGGTGWMPLSRLVRDLVVHETRLAHILAARALGATPWSIARHHLAPAVMPLVAVWGGALFAECILLEAGLSYLGLGVPAPTPSWGTVLRDVGDVFGQARWLMLGPGLWIAVVVAGLQSITDRPLRPDDPTLNGV